MINRGLNLYFTNLTNHRFVSIFNNSLLHFRYRTNVSNIQYRVTW